MRKFWLVISLMAAALLAACASATPAVQSSTRAPAPLPSPTAALLTSEPAVCTVSSRLPTPGPTEVSLFPSPGKEDWKKGPDNARVVFLEYGDFQ
jgi:hypothetical protein